ncbi:1-deoxy-D-xylulose-5-phosphate reductoisomerase [Pseudodesulfovibrio piezophilus]|uniref:1-deoxy-D-xylulose 5-phosphate reductoisomerase n=1 Tax=Pseudodesulfovibrio piezophilus (strain DSM 21447 / JCM 15486 / C1TLV30) TaxID=1322246 RepID=M1WMW7_PSEP2|nr:1-deoxy-D-xylulose-5-phosphate reductoisomerase [Pseudodesulfovibrio piezophilus]CCH47244.1 1-deoxy-D-xylulose 5-phosphate reductoisomerase [Pseudodesulfovibrio piezophilus C1TLV30]
MQTYISPWPLSVPQPDFPRSICILGATGSIGTSALKVIRKHPDLFTVTALAGGANAKRLAQLCVTFRPPHVGVLNEQVRQDFISYLPCGYTPEIHVGPEGYATLAALNSVDLVLSSIVGAAGFIPTLAAAQAGKMIGLANKESLVLGGHVIRKECHASGATIFPVDSEHNALFQGLVGHQSSQDENTDLKRLILTASGGPFRGRNKNFLQTVTRDQALAHPNWDMGAKISIDSATLMNKGLEVIEACHLYGVPVEKIDVVVHAQSIIHSLVEYMDGSQLAHLGNPDMQIPIAHCLCFPRRVEVDVPQLNLAQVGTLTFEDPDEEAFPCLRLAREAFAAGQSHPIVLNAVNEVAVAAFLNEKIHFLDIPQMIEQALTSHQAVKVDTPSAILELDRITREEAESSL